MTEFEEECVIAMKLDSTEKYLAAGDTAGFIAVFDIENYCTTAKVLCLHIVLITIVSLFCIICHSRKRCS